MDDKNLVSTVNKACKTKAQVIIGTQRYINATTHEIEEFTVIEKNIDKDFNFHKIWLQDILQILDSFGNCKIQILAFLLKKMRNEDNTVSVTYQYIHECTGISKPTIGMTMRALVRANVLRKIMSSTYQFNPDIIIQGRPNKRQKLLVQYNFPEDEKLLDIKKIEDKNGI